MFNITEYPGIRCCKCGQYRSDDYYVIRLKSGEALEFCLECSSQMYSDGVTKKSTDEEILDWVNNKENKECQLTKKEKKNMNLFHLK